MASVLILKVRMCLKPLKIFHQGSPAFLSINSHVGNSPSARFLCTRDINPSQAGRGGQKVDNSTSRAAGNNGTVNSAQEQRSLDAAEWRGSKKPFIPNSVFFAGHAKRRLEFMKTKCLPPAPRPKGGGAMSSRKGLVPPDRPLSTAEWRELKESSGNSDHFDVQMMHAMASFQTELNVAKSLLNYVAMEKGTLSYRMLLAYLMFCERGGYDEEAFDLYGLMRGSFSSLETGATSLFIKSFSRTGRWREALRLLRDIKKVFMPSSSSYGEIIKGAMASGDVTTAWALYDEVLANGQNPNPDSWEALFQRVTKSQGEEEEEGAVEGITPAEHHERLLGVLNYLKENQIYAQEVLAKNIKTWFESLEGQKWRGTWTTPTATGVCMGCGTQLESINLTDEEYEQLKKSVMVNIIEAGDIFKKTTPKELKLFKQFVKTSPPFDVVLDGLNVANLNRHQRRLSANLLSVVMKLKYQGLNILVLGRKHMLYHSYEWDRDDMTLIKQNAQCFFTDNNSQDDPFLLYATLNSGNHCLFLSQDLMRDHKACLPDGATRQLFFKWQRGHQLVVKGLILPGKRVQFQNIASHDTIIQTTGDSWHIPYDHTQDRSSSEIPYKWLCLTKTH